MKLNENQWKAVQTCIQSVIVALLLMAQSLLSGCVTADNGASVNIDKDTNINIPVNIPENIFKEVSMIENCKNIWHDSDGYLSAKKIKYDSIVDDKDFSSLKQQKRLERLSQEGAGQSSGSPLYDFKAGQKRDFVSVSDAIIALRSNKLDKADVAEIQKLLLEEAREEVNASEKASLEKQAQDVSRQRQEFMDAEMGFSPTSNPASV